MTFISYAQNFEDVMLMRALKNVQRGFYIDVGACAPDSDSVTRLFYGQGWRGINIEPNPHYLQLLSEQRNGDKNLGIALSDTEGTLTFHLISEPGLSSLNAEIAAAHEAEGMSSTELSVRVSTLQSLWAEHVPVGREVHFLKIDVEGEEAGVIRGGDWAKHRPWIVVVEATAPASQKPSHEEWEPTLLSHGYRFAYWDGLNRFYVADEHADLARAFHAPPNVFDDFVRYSQVLIQNHANALNTRLSTLEQENEALRQQEKLLQEQEKLLQEQEKLLQEQEKLLQEQEKLLQEQEALRQEQEALRQEREARYSMRPFWEKILFRKTGRPIRAVRRTLFHSNGKPRDIFRGIVQHKNGRPRRAFYDWMTHPDYQALPRDVVVLEHSEPEKSPPSPRTQYFMDRMGNKSSEDRVQ